MKNTILPEIQKIAKTDFEEIGSKLKENNIVASVDSIHYSKVRNVVTATCDFQKKGSEEVIVASISYQNGPDGVYADADIDEMSEAILGAVSDSLVPITAADDEEDPFVFDEDFEDEPKGDEEVVEEDEEALEGEEDNPMEDPEETPNIEEDNNIAGHYIVECNRCQGIFISALTESDQKVEFLSGVCPLCEKESDQYIKWVIKPVEDQ